MHEAEFCSSFSPQRVRVFGVRMDVYAIGHEMAMLQQGNPLATYSEASFAELAMDAKKLALAMALEICGRAGFISKWILALRLSRMSETNLSPHIKDFQSYRAQGSLDFPLAKMPRTGGVPFHYFGAPELSRLLNYVTTNHAMLINSHFKGSPLNFPLGLAQMLHTAYLESSGQIWVKNFQDMERERPKRDGTPAAGANEKVLTGDAADMAYKEAVELATKGKN